MANIENACTSARELKKLCERRLEGYEFVVLILDGKTFDSMCNEWNSIGKESFYPLSGKVAPP